MDEVHRMADIRDGSSNTVLLGEMAWNEGVFSLWPRSTGGGSGATYAYCCRNIRYTIHAMAVADLPGKANNVSLGSEHPGGCNFLVGDGSARFLPESTDVTILQALATRSEGEVAMPWQ
jgi:hypothetical protein